MSECIHSWLRNAERLLIASFVACSTAVAQPRFAELRRMHLPADEDESRGVAVGDLDGDGDLDAVFVAAGVSRVRRNDGGARFVDTQQLGTSLTQAVALADLDGDGDLDVVLANRSQNTIYLNDGSGSFTDATAGLPQDADDTVAVAVADVDGDGDADLLWGNELAQNRLYLNDGGALFFDRTSGRLPVDSDEVGAVAFCDVDGDGDPDAVIGNTGSGARGQNRLLVNDGTGVFADESAARLPALEDRTRAVACVDVDGDADLDLVFVNAGMQSRLYTNDGLGFFADATAAALPVADDTVQAVAAGDLDGDGDADLVLGGWPRDIVYTNDGSGRFTRTFETAEPAVTTGVALGDVDGDGDQDLLAARARDVDRLLLNDGAGGFADASGTRLPADDEETAAVVAFDADGDGDRDLCFGNSNGEPNRLLMNDGSGRLHDETASRLPDDRTATTAAAAADVDGDGDLDLVFANAREGLVFDRRNRLYLNDGTGRFAEAPAGQLPADDDDSTAVAFADVDADGDLDIVLGGNAADRVYLNDGLGAFTDVTTARLPGVFRSTTSLALGDVDGDGDPDLVFGDIGTVTPSRLYLNDGTGVFVDATAARMPPGHAQTRALALADVDGDGDLDIVYANAGRDQLFENDGQGTFVDATAGRLPFDVPSTTDVALADLDGDGDADCVFAANGVTRVFRNDGTGRFDDATSGTLGFVDHDTLAILLDDLDDDGDVDLVFGNDGRNALFLNLTRQLDAPYLLLRGGDYELVAHASRSAPPGFDAVLPFLSFAEVFAPIPPFGTFRLDPTTAVPLPLAVLPQPLGEARVVITVPDDPHLIGRVVFTQALIIQQPGVTRLTNMVRDSVVR